MRIDWHVHINDPKYMGPKWWKHPVPMTVEHALDAHRLVGLDERQVRIEVGVHLDMDDGTGGAGSQLMHVADRLVLNSPPKEKRNKWVGNIFLVF